MSPVADIRLTVEHFGPTRRQRVSVIRCAECNTVLVAGEGGSRRALELAARNATARPCCPTWQTPCLLCGDPLTDRVLVCDPCAQEHGWQ